MACYDAGIRELDAYERRLVWKKRLTLIGFWLLGIGIGALIIAWR